MSVQADKAVLAMLTALNAVQKSLERKPEPRHYSPDPAADIREADPIEPRDAEEFFLSEQCPSDRAFR